MDHADFQGNKLVKKFYELKRSSLSHELYQEFLSARGGFSFSQAHVRECKKTSTRSEIAGFAVKSSSQWFGTAIR